MNNLFKPEFNIRYLTDPKPVLYITVTGLKEKQADIARDLFYEAIGEKNRETREVSYGDMLRNDDTRKSIAHTGEKFFRSYVKKGETALRFFEALHRRIEFENPSQIRLNIEREIAALEGDITHPGP